MNKGALIILKYIKSDAEITKGPSFPLAFISPIKTYNGVWSKNKSSTAKKHEFAKIVWVLLGSDR